MPYFPDLSPYTYTDPKGLEIVNIGWLDEGNIFPVGATTVEFK